MKKTLYIIDGHAQIFAAYYAPMGANLVSPSGEPTKATYIFTNMLLKLIHEQKPDHLIVALDAPGPTFRHEMYDQYKANRPEAPEDLPVQINRIKDILQAMEITTCSIDGFEADDLIATLSKIGVEKDHKVYICSKDKDLEQLIGPDVVMFSPKDGKVLDEKSLFEKKGIRPDQVADILALTGDTSDNIPGVPDVGPKTAQQWIQKYDTLENLLDNADQIKGKRGNSLRESTDILKLSRELVAIREDAPIDIDWDDLTIKPLEQPELIELFKELGFTRLLTQLNKDADIESPQVETPAAVPINTKKIEAHLIDNETSFDTFFEELKKQTSFAIDTETTSLNPINAELVGLSISWKEGEGYYLPFQVPLGQAALDKEKTLEKLAPIFADPNIKKSGQNIKYDTIILRCAGAPLDGINFDTMIASYLQDSTRTRHNLDILALELLGHETIHLESLIGKGKKQITFDLVEPHLAADYAAEDAEVTWRLTKLFEDRFNDKDLKKLYDDVELPLLEVLAEMEFHGVALNVPWLKKVSSQMSERIDLLVEEIYKESGREFNVDSPKQLAEVLFTDLALAPVKKGKTGPSTDQEVLETLSWQHPVPKLMLEYRTLSKLKNTYVDKLPSMISPKTKRVHASFNQTVAATGRLSSSNPNLQNIPIRTEQGQKIRKAFVAQGDGNILLAADYSQIELRLLAHFSQDPGLLDAFHTNQDIHQFVAAQVNNIELDEVDSEQRSQAKAVNFGIIYGQTPFGLSRTIGIPVDEAKRFIDSYFERYPKIKHFMDGVIEEAKENGFVKTLLGRRRSLPDIHSKAVARRNLAQRMAVNTVVQGSAADMIKVAMINLHKKIQDEKLDLKMILQVHDELVFELPEEKATDYAQIIRHQMTEALELDVPMIVDIGTGPNWLECK